LDASESDRSSESLPFQVVDVHQLLYHDYELPLIAIEEKECRKEHVKMYQAFRSYANTSDDEDGDEGEEEEELHAASSFPGRDRKYQAQSVYRMLK
jgi:hypothetical protein